MKHEQKVRPALYGRIADGSKTFWIGDTDDGIQFGDTILLREWSDEKVNPTSDSPKGFTGQEIELKVGYVHVLSSSKVVVSLLPMAAKKGR